jgi:predicted nucleotide-binding protein
LSKYRPRTNEGGFLPKPRVFIGSSSEGSAIAEAVRLQLRRETEPTLWSRDVFLPSDYTLETLEKQITMHCFAVLVASPDDALITRGTSYPAMRDNVLVEFGLFVGALGRRHAFFICPSTPRIKLPSDLLGVTTATYDATRIPKKLGSRDAVRRVKGACQQVLKVIKREWSIMQQQQSEEVKRLQGRKKVKAARRLHTVASRLFTETQREAFTRWSDLKAFKKFKATAKGEIRELAQSYAKDASLLGLQDQLKELRRLAINALRELPYPQELSVAAAKKMQRRLSMQALKIKHRHGTRAANKYYREAAMRQIEAQGNRARRLYKKWWNEHWSGLQQASGKMNDALVSIFVELARDQQRERG